MPIRVLNVGHVVLKVRDIERSARFYRDVLGLKEVARGEFGRPMAFFSTGDNHHDIAVMEMGADAPAPPAEATGLYHVALRIGTTLDELRAARAHLEAHGITKLRVRDHGPQAGTASPATAIAKKGSQGTSTRVPTPAPPRQSSGVRVRT